jgi:hypothetical protein
MRNVQGATVFECRLKNIPCQIAYWNIEMYAVLDRKGYDAMWLQRQVEDYEIQELIAEDRRDRREMCDE